MVLALPACAPLLQEFQGPAYSVSEVELLTPDASERWLYFYGDPQTIILEGKTLDLQPPPAHAHIWAVPGALWVSGQPLFREVLPALRPPALTVEAIPSFAYYVRSRVDLDGVWIYDGAWRQLAGNLRAGDSVQGAGEPSYPDLKGLSDAEEKVVLRELLARNPVRPLIIYQLAEPVYPAYRFDPAPISYRRATLSVQYGVGKEIVLDSAPNPSFSWKVLAKGTMSAYKDPSPLGLLAVSDRFFKSSVWSLAMGNRIPKPPASALDFDRQSVAAFFWGLKSSGGYSVDVKNVRLEGDVLEVSLILRRPPPGAIVTQALTSPYVAVVVEGKPRLVRFFDQTGKLIEEARAH